jgi:hypothetical protein
MLDVPLILTVLFPSALVGGSAALCGVGREAGAGVPFRPPPVVFSLVWPVLLLALGVALQRAACKWPLVLLTAGLAAWMLVYSPRCGGHKAAACWVLVLDLWLALVAFGLSCGACEAFGTAVTAAFVAWLAFALLMNCFEVARP